MGIPWYGISNLLIMITSLAMSIFVFVKGPKTRAHRVWSILTFCVAIYGFGAYMVSISDNAQTAFFWWRASYIGITLIPALFTHFTCSFLDIKPPRLVKMFYFGTGILWILNFVGKELFPGNVRLFFVESKIFKAGYWIYPPTFLLYIFIIFFFFGLAIWSHAYLFKYYRKATGLKRHQLRYFFTASAMAFIGGGTSFLPCFNIEVYPVLNITVALYPLIMGYAMVRYRLMDITVAFTRTGIFAAVYTLLLGIPYIAAVRYQSALVEIFGVNWWIVPAVIMAISATLGPFIYIYLERKAEKRLLSEQRRYQSTLRQAAREMARIHNLRKLLNLIVHTVTRTVRIFYAAIYIFDNNTNQFILKTGRNANKAQPSIISEQNPLISWFKEHREPLVFEEVSRRAQEHSKTAYRELEAKMRFLNASVIIPGFIDNRMIGFLILGDKRSGKIYSSEDLNTFSLLANQAALAIENALLYENIEEQVRQRTKELVEVQRQLIQAEKMATVGTLAGGVAHEINNPLTAILTNAQMILADNKKLDVESKESLELIEEATQRCRTIVKKLMTYAKKPLEPSKMDSVDIADVINKVVSFLAYQLEQDNIKVIKNFKGGAYLTTGIPNELEQVIINIILNAKDAVKRVKKSGYIYIFLFEDRNWIKIQIKDEGIGISKEIMSKIFDPFFTTKEVGKGLGLGLSICQAIVDKHNGLIKVESEPNKGSIFTVQLPKIKEANKAKVEV